MSDFSNNIRPFVETEFTLAIQARLNDDVIKEFTHLENAHVLGQESTVLHVRAHYLMLCWAIRNVEWKETLGQLFRIAGAATKTAFGLIPHGNTGGSNVSPFRALPLKPEHAAIINSARDNT